MTIRQTGAHGDFVDTLLQVVALDDVVGLILYSMAISVAIASETGSLQLSTVMMPTRFGGDAQYGAKLVALSTRGIRLDSQAVFPQAFDG